MKKIHIIDTFTVPEIGDEIRMNEKWYSIVDIRKTGTNYDVMLNHFYSFIPLQNFFLIRKEQEQEEVCTVTFWK